MGQGQARRDRSQRGHRQGLRPGPAGASRAGQRVHRHSRERVLHAAGPVRLRQDHAAPADRRLRISRPKARSCSTARTSPACRPSSRPVNTVFQSYALFPHLTVCREHRLRPADARQATRPRSPRASPRCCKLVQMEELGRPPHRPDFRRPGAARGAGARAGAEPEGAAARRAAVGARLQAAQGDADRAQAHAARDRHHLRLRHARPGGGADDVRPHRRHVERARSCRSARRATSTSIRPTASSPISSARPTSWTARWPGERATAPTVRLNGGGDARRPHRGMAACPPAR